MSGKLVPAAEAGTVLDAARELAGELARRAREGEQLRTLPADLVERARAAGLFRLLLPVSLGGLELEPAQIIEIVETLCRADGSAGWTILIANCSGFFAWLEPATAREMIGDDPDFASTSMFGPLGRAVPDGAGGYVVSGRWPFNSGSPHARWLQVGVLVMDGDAPAERSPGVPDWRFAFIPREAADIEDTWDALGLRGTGSHHLSIRELPVPEDHLAAPVFEAARHPGPLWKLPLFTLSAIMMVGLPLGVARRALDEFTALARTKFRGAPGATVAEDGFAQVELARAEAGVQAARAYVFDVVADLWATCSAGDPPSLEQRARMLLAANHAMRTGVEAVDRVFRLAGAEAVYADHPLQRCLRDIHTADQHILFSSDRDKRYTRLRLGIEQATFMI